MRYSGWSGGQLAGSLKIVFGHEDLAPAAEGRAPEDPSRRDVGVRGREAWQAPRRSDRRPAL